MVLEDLVELVDFDGAVLIMVNLLKHIFDVLILLILIIGLQVLLVCGLCVPGLQPLQWLLISHLSLFFFRLLRAFYAGFSAGFSLLWRRIRHRVLWSGSWNYPWIRTNSSICCRIDGSTFKFLFHVTDRENFRRNMVEFRISGLFIWRTLLV